MNRKPLKVSIIQSILHWENAQANMQMFEEKIATIENKPHIVILPEMFNTGFSMQPHIHAQSMQGDTLQWMENVSKKFKIILAGSIAIQENEQYYNRFVWMQPNGQYTTYDKRHLFSYANEHMYYKAGNNKLIVQVNGWKIVPIICYDLRFPVWCRQEKNNIYDILLCVANWPHTRIQAWDTLLKARAIENMCYTIGVNRVGTDNNNLQYIGHSQIIDPLGNTLQIIENEEAIISYTFETNDLENIRTKFPFLDDRDNYVIL